LRSEDWNQPRCWSPPSVYMSAGNLSSGSCSSTASQEAPDSNQTSRMSISLRKSLLPQLAQEVFFGRRSATSCLYQASAPSFSKSATMDLLILESLSGSWQALQRKTAMGTPQMRWREMVQSGRVATMLEMRSSPQLGSQATRLISSR